jgi:GTP-binding protein
VILIMDVRRPLTELDHQLMNWLKPSGVPVHILLSKSDKLGQQKAVATLREVNAVLARDYLNCSAQLFSSTRKIGIADAAKQIQRWLSVGSNKKPPVKGE